MSETRTVTVNLDLLWVIIAILLTVGEPDLLDGLIHWLMK